MFAHHVIKYAHFCELPGTVLLQAWSLTAVLLGMQILGQDEVNSFLSEQIQSQMELRFRQGRCQCEPVGPEWKDLLDSISELLTHHLQQVDSTLNPK